MITVEMPSGTMQIQEPTCIGHFYVIACMGERFVANCLDESDGRPKRMRIQLHPVHGGKVVQAHEYTIIERDPAWED